ncbi:MAG: ATPase, T2SS/T4P/T4SS family [candidate division FCPU426 bacterium]
MAATDQSAGLMLVLHGGKAGEGKSLLAQNLAASLRQTGRAVALVDLDVQARSEQKLRADLGAGNTLAEIAAQLNRFDAATLRGYFPQTASGVEVIALADNAAGALGVSSQQILRSLSLFRQAYDVIVVDGLAGWDRLALSVLDAADRILLVCSPDLVGLRQARADTLRYQELKFPAAKISLVLNRADVPHALRLEDLEKTLPGFKVLASLPYADQATEAVNQHRELIQLYPHAAFAKQVKAMSQALLAVDTRYRSDTWQPEEGETQPAQAQDKREDLTAVKERIHGLLLENPELRHLASESGRTAAGQAFLRDKVEAVVTSLMAQEASELTNRELREQLVREMVDEALGLGPLEDLIRDPSVTEIMVNRADQIYLERRGRLERSDKHFLSDKQLMTVIERIVAPLGRRIDESQPYVDARLADGSRVNAIIPPLALKGPTLTIRKFSKQRYTVEDLMKFGSLTKEMADFLGASVRCRKNIVISGGTGSGKTTLLNIVAAFIPEDERIITVEDAAELNLPQPHVVTLEARPANIEGKGAITIRDLVRNCLRMRPDRIVVGECRGGEALDMLQAMNTGHDGSLTTAHANSPKDAVSRLETMVLMSGMELPVRAIREQIAGAVHLVVQQSRLQDGSRKITQIAEVLGIEDGQVALKDVFVFKQTGVDKSGKVAGDYRATGYVPSFVSELASRGIALDEKIFRKG